MVSTHANIGSFITLDTVSAFSWEQSALTELGERAGFRSPLSWPPLSEHVIQEQLLTRQISDMATFAQVVEVSYMRNLYHKRKGSMIGA